MVGVVETGMSENRKAGVQKTANKQTMAINSILTEFWAAEVVCAN